MSHDTENPLIIDVVGEVEPAEPMDERASKKAGRSAGKKSFFKKEKPAPGVTATQAASEAEVNAAKRAATAAAVPPVQGPVSHKPKMQEDVVANAAEEQPSVLHSEAEAVAAPQIQDEPATVSVQSDQQATVDPAQAQEAVGAAPEAYMPSQAVAAEAAQPVQAQAQQPETTRPQAVPVQQAPQSAQPVQSIPVQQVNQPAARPAQQVQRSAQHVQQPAQQVQQPPQTVQPSQQAQPQSSAASAGFAPAPAPQRAQQAAYAPVAAPHKSRAFYVFGILAAAAAVFALGAIGFFGFLQPDEQNMLVSTSHMDQDSSEVKPIVSASLDQASKVSLRATAENWNENDSTPVIAYIKRVTDASEKTSGEGPAERYFAFAPNQSASVALPAGRYAFTFVPPVNSDGSIYAVPDMVDMVVGDGGMAVLPVDFKRVSKDDVSQELAARIVAQLKTASEKGDSSFETDAFKRSIDLALTSWFSQGDAAEKPATDLTQEQQNALNAQAQSNGQQAESSSSSAAEHAHDWIAQHERRWNPAIVPVIDTAAWESPVYARYRCQEGILFETLDACLAHVRQRGNEPYAASNEIIRIDYHPAVVHYEEQGTYEDVITGYRCSICGASGSL